MILTSGRTSLAASQEEEGSGVILISDLCMLHCTVQSNLASSPGLLYEGGGEGLVSTARACAKISVIFAVYVSVYVQETRVHARRRFTEEVFRYPQEQEAEVKILSAAHYPELL